MTEGSYSCRECGWSGINPVHKTWVGGGPTAVGGSYNICPECEKTVRTEEGWHRHDNPTFFDKPLNFFLAVCLVGLATLAIVIFLGS